MRIIVLECVFCDAPKRYSYCIAKQDAKIRNNYYIGEKNMKKSSVMMIAVTLLLSSCGTFTRLASSAEGQKFTDGIYSNGPDLMSKEERVAGRKETDALIEKTKGSEIYLFGDRKDTIMVPEHYSATIKYDRSLGSTVVTVGDNPYDWRNNLNPWSYYSPYSIGSTWYWSRHWSPFWSMSWNFGWSNPWYYGWSDPWYYGGYWGRWYDPFSYWGYWGWYDPWYYGGYYPWYPHYAGWYGGFGPHWGHGHGHGPGHGHGGHFTKDRWHGPRHETQNDERVFAGSGRTTVRRGVGISSSTGRETIGSSSSRSSVTASKASGGSSVSRRAGARKSSSSATGSQATHRRPAVSPDSSSGSSSSYTRGSSGSSSQSRGAIDNRSTVSRNSSGYDRSSSNSSYSRGSSSTSTRSSGYSGGGGGYSRGSTGGGGGSRGGSVGGRR